MVVSIFGVLAGFIAAFVALLNGMPLAAVLLSYAICGSLIAGVMVVAVLIRASRAEDGADRAQDWTPDWAPVPAGLGAQRETIAGRGFATAMTAIPADPTSPRRS